MSKTSPVPAVFAYLLPVIGWLYVFLVERKNELAVFHVKQAIGLVLFLIVAMIAWGVVAYVLAWIPYGMAIGMALFMLVIAAYVYAFIAWILGMIRALRKESTPLPVFGKYADRLPI